NPAGPAFGTETFYFSFLPVGAELFFAADDGSTGVELWRSDGSSDGTQRVADIFPGPEGSFPAFLTRTPDGARIVYQACEPAGGCEAWQTEMASGATTRLADIAPGAASSNAAGFASAGNRLYFIANDGARGTELWSEAAVCTGDCNGDGMVTIDELIRAVRIPLGEALLDVCPAADATGD